MSKHNAEPRSENEKNPSQGTDWLGFYTANAKPPRRKTIFLIKAQPSQNQKTPRELERRSVFFLMRQGRMGAVTRRYLSFPEGTGLLVVQLDARVKPELVETVAANKISKSHDGIDEH